MPRCIRTSRVRGCNSSSRSPRRHGIRRGGHERAAREHAEACSRSLPPKGAQAERMTTPNFVDLMFNERVRRSRQPGRPPCHRRRDQPCAVVSGALEGSRRRRARPGPFSAGSWGGPPHQVISPAVAEEVLQGQRVGAEAGWHAAEGNSTNSRSRSRCRRSSRCPGRPRAVAGLAAIGVKAIAVRPWRRRPSSTAPSTPGISSWPSMRGTRPGPGCERVLAIECHPLERLQRLRWRRWTPSWTPPWTCSPNHRAEAARVSAAAQVARPRGRRCPRGLPLHAPGLDGLRRPRCPWRRCRPWATRLTATTTSRPGSCGRAEAALVPSGGTLPRWWNW